MFYPQTELPELSMAMESSMEDAMPATECEISDEVLVTMDIIDASLMSDMTPGTSGVALQLNATSSGTSSPTTSSSTSNGASKRKRTITDPPVDSRG
jgi:hypothetical protein